MNFKELGSNLGLEIDEFNEIVELFIGTAAADIEKLQAGLKSGDTNKAVEAAHSLKGSSGNLGFADFSAVAKTAEKNFQANNLEGTDEIISELKENLKHIVTNFETVKAQ